MHRNEQSVMKRIFGILTLFVGACCVIAGACVFFGVVDGFERITVPRMALTALACFSFGSYWIYHKDND